MNTRKNTPNLFACCVSSCQRDACMTTCCPDDTHTHTHTHTHTQSSFSCACLQAVCLGPVRSVAAFRARAVLQEYFGCIVQRRPQQSIRLCSPPFFLSLSHIPSPPSLCLNESLMLFSHSIHLSADLFGETPSRWYFYPLGRRYCVRQTDSDLFLSRRKKHV